MDYEPLLTILFALGIAAALVVYSAFPRGRSAAVSMASPSVASFAPVGAVNEAPMPEVTAVEPVAVEVSPAPESLGVVDATPVAVETAPAPVASAIDVPAIAAAQPAEAVASTVKPRRSTKRKSTTTKTRARASRKVKAQA